MPLGDVPVEDGERLARMIFTNRHVRKDQSVRAEAFLSVRMEAFLPYKHVTLSVIRHRDLTEPELWEIGQEIAAARNLPLIGRGDIGAHDARGQGLDVVPVEGPGIPRNHADIVGWPPDKPSQMSRAVELAAASHFTAAPTGST